MSELQLREIRKQYGDNVVVDNLNLSVESGEMVSLLGPSGCGKTTTLRMIAGLLEPTSGSIRLAGRELVDVPPHKRNVGLVFQNYALFPHLSIFENVAFGLRRQGTPKEEIKERVEAALRSVHLAGYEKRLPAQLSGGQQQRVALARTLVLRPPLVLFDEPLSNLDAKLRQMLRIEIRQLQQEFKFTGIFVTHDQEEAMVLSDRIAVMHQGHIVQLGTPQEIYSRPNNAFVADFVGESNFLRIQNAAAENGEWRLTLAGGQSIRAAGGSPEQTAVQAMVRPEAVNIRRSADPDTTAPEARAEQNTLAGQVAFTHYTGASYLIGVTVEGMDKHFLARVTKGSPQGAPVAPGDSVAISWPVPATFVL